MAAETSDEVLVGIKKRWRLGGGGLLKSQPEGELHNRGEFSDKS